jgi:lipoprotein Spr
LLQAKYAGMLGVLPGAISNFALYHFIEDWYNVRYRLGGTDKSGIDCSAFAQKLYESVFCTNLFRSAVEQFRTCELIFSTDSLKEGDLVFFRTRGRRISHVGIYLMNDHFVHASASHGVIISSLKEEYWNRNYAGAGKINKEGTL